jgi:hypothetical protein
MEGGAGVNGRGEKSLQPPGSGDKPSFCTEKLSAYTKKLPRAPKKLRAATIRSAANSKNPKIDPLRLRIHPGASLLTLPLTLSARENVLSL